MSDPSPVRSLGNHPSLRERIATHLREAIVSGDLPAKTRLMEPELARRLGVSRTPLREAIRQLEAEGFLSTIPRMGTFVAEVTARDLEDVYAIRAVLEGLAARQAAEQTDGASAGLRTLLTELARKTTDYREYHEASGRFHEAVLTASGNQRLQALYHTLTHQVARLRRLSLAVARRPEVSLREHRRIASAILRGRGPEAERLMRSHVEGALAIVRRRIRRQGEPSKRRPR
ncbi:MAG TPA: GntR family transcriptional regulator [Candidatus Methylomirabilis sp.]